MRKRTTGLLVWAALLMGLSACSKDSTAPPTQPQVGAPAGLSAVPPTVAVGIGGIQHVNVTGGTPPYSIASAPGAIATADIANADSSIAVLKITGVTVASVATSVVVRDNTPSSPKTVSIPITVF
ncbi:MAG TPA: hypothetical protein VMF59_09210 [Bacteroidota bacterium]|nr:hypothetical protein [Bacteroidota bacterium]